MDDEEREYSLEERINIAKSQSAKGLTRELAMFVLGDTEYLQLRNINEADYRQSLVSARMKMFEQAVEGRGFFVETLFGPSGIEPKFNQASEFLSELLSEAKIDPLYYEAATMVCEKILRENPATMHPLLAMWSADVLAGHVVPPPKKKGPDPIKYTGRNSVVAFAVDALVEVGFSPTRNAASEPVSACDYVSEAVGKLAGVNLSYDAVAKIYTAEVRRSKG